MFVHQRVAAGRSCAPFSPARLSAQLVCGCLCLTCPACLERQEHHGVFIHSVLDNLGV